MSEAGHLTMAIFTATSRGNRYKEQLSGHSPVTPARQPNHGQDSFFWPTRIGIM